MDIKKEIGSLQLMERMRVRIFDSGDAAAVSRCHAEIDNAMHGINRWLDMAEAAIAMAEHQAFAPYDPVVGGELWRAFVEAHKAAKDANQS